MTSISVVSPDDPESVRMQHERDYKKYAVESMQATVTKPKFKFYLYNEEGDLVQEELSIHDIQHFLLHSAYNVNSEIAPMNNIFSRLNSSDNGSQEEKEGKVSFLHVLEIIEYFHINGRCFDNHKSDLFQTQTLLRRMIDIRLISQSLQVLSQ